MNHLKLPVKRIICLYGGPGAGKSTTAAGLFYRLKLLGYNSELNREVIKNWVWEKRPIYDGDQTTFFAEQSRLERLFIMNSLDFVVTDSPLILTHFYGLKGDWLEQKYNTSEILLRHHHEFCKAYGYKTEHFLLQRTKSYNPSGRVHTETEANLFDLEIAELLTQKNILFHTIPGDESAVDNILHILANQQLLNGEIA